MRAGEVPTPQARPGDACGCCRRWLAVTCGVPGVRAQVRDRHLEAHAIGRAPAEAVPRACHCPPLSAALSAPPPRVGGSPHAVPATPVRVRVGQAPDRAPAVPSLPLHGGGGEQEGGGACNRSLPAACCGSGCIQTDERPLTCTAFSRPRRRRCRHTRCRHTRLAAGCGRRAADGAGGG